MRRNGKIYEYLSDTAHTFLFYLFRICPIQKNKVLFTSYSGKGYGDNAKYICEALRQKNRNFDFVWTIVNDSIELPAHLRGVQIGTVRWIYEMATAQVWIDNSRKMKYVRKRKKQYYIQTWHGDIALKKVEQDASHVLAPRYVENAINDSKMADLFVSGNEWMTNLYRQKFWYTGEIATCGYPRRDILYSDKEHLAKLKESIKIPTDYHVFFYAPTFRRNQAELGVSTFELHWESLLDSLHKRFGGKWIGFIRLHPNISHMASQLQLPDNVWNMTNYPDMQELLAVSDICLSDYSSSVFEFAVTGRPAFIYAGDFKAYQKDRDTYFPLEVLPFPVAQNEQALIDNILSFDELQYQKKRNAFYYDTLGVYKEGYASQEIANIIEKVCFGQR